MKCVRLHLSERGKSKPRGIGAPARASSSPRHYCQKRLANPQHEEDPRWLQMIQRFRCTDYEQENLNETFDTEFAQADNELYLSVQTLKFEGLEKQPQPSKCSFKYKRSTDGRNHRLFIKENIDIAQQQEEDRSSKLSSYYFDNYVQQILQSEQSRPSSEKSKIIVPGLYNKLNKSTQVSPYKSKEKSINPKKKVKPKTIEMCMNKDSKQENKNCKEKSKISFHKSGKRKSLTISRTQSPESVQIIRVDVMCNRTSTCSTMTDFEDLTKNNTTVQTSDPIGFDSKLNHRSNNYYKKYLLTNTVKGLEENLATGKVTLLCKTFRLADRAKTVRRKT